VGFRSLLRPDAAQTLQANPMVVRRGKSRLAGDQPVVVKGARFQRIVPPKGDKLSETEGQGTMDSLRILLRARLGCITDQDTEGQGLVEYALIILLIAIACLAALTALSNAILTQLWGLVTSVLIPAL
jgi:Flp pilus assembly pilin Flp